MRRSRCGRIRTWRLEVEGGGTRSAGWQRLPLARTSQGELEKSAENFIGIEVETGGAAFFIG